MSVAVRSSGTQSALMAPSADVALAVIDVGTFHWMVRGAPPIVVVTVTSGTVGVAAPPPIGTEPVRVAVSTPLATAYVWLAKLDAVKATLVMVTPDGMLILSLTSVMVAL